MNTLRERLIHARHTAQLTQAQVAQRAGMSQAAYQKLEGGKAERSRFITDVAHVLGVQPKWLMDGKGDPSAAKSRINEHQNVEPAHTKMRSFAPEISWVAAGAWADSCHIETDPEAVNWHPRPASASEDTFVLRVSGLSMWPEYQEGVFIFVDPRRDSKSGDDVIAVMTDTGETTFKRLSIEPSGERSLRAINPDWRNPILPINGNCQIIGVVVADMRIR